MKMKSILTPMHDHCMDERAESPGSDTVSEVYAGSSCILSQDYAVLPISSAFPVSPGCIIFILLDTKHIVKRNRTFESDDPSFKF